MGLPGLRTHRKFRRLAAILQIPEAHVLGHLQMMWETSWDHLSPYLGDATDVDLSAGWAGAPGALAPALVTCGGDEPGFLEEREDGRYLIHDWREHAPRWVRVKVQKREELAREGKTIADVKRAAGIAGAAVKWKNHVPKNGKPAQVCQEENGTCHEKDGEKCPSPPLPSLLLKDKDSKESSPEPGRADEVVSIWNETTKGKLPRAKLTKTRTTTIRTRLKEPGWLDDFRTACTFLASSAFHQGQNDRRWVATLDFLLKTDKATELAEKAGTPTPNATGAPNVSRSPAHRAAVDAAYLQSIRDHPATVQSPEDEAEVLAMWDRAAGG